MEEAVVAIGYVLAWRLVLLARPFWLPRVRGAWGLLLLLCFAVGAGWLIGEWWAPALALVNGTIFLVWGPKEAVDRWVKKTLVVVTVEAACLAGGVSARLAALRQEHRRQDESMEQMVAEHLQGVLGWAHAVRETMDRDPGESREHQMQGHAYVGGVLSTLSRLELLTEVEHKEWADRLMAVLGAPPGGFIDVDG